MRSCKSVSVLLLLTDTNSNPFSSTSSCTLRQTLTHTSFHLLPHNIPLPLHFIPPHSSATTEEEKQRLAAEEAAKIEETKRFLIEEAARVALLREEAEEQIRVAMMKANETMAEVQKLEKLRATESTTANSNKKRVNKLMKNQEAKHAAKRTGWFLRFHTHTFVNPSFIVFIYARYLLLLFSLLLLCPFLILLYSIRLCPALSLLFFV